ncbi:MAG: non-canonical purine NTP pyrophosphatase [Bdellovibrionales bacterium]|nr:non-canonical purine NTP pyrophosphatase [Bdellovibrionales bacterium]
MAKLNRIVAATGNPNKLKELQVVGARFDIEIIAPSTIQSELNLSEPPEVDENGTTYYENAKLKADQYLEWCGQPCLGDDSGLEVTALGNIPGLRSARYLGDGLSYEVRMKNLIDLLQEREQAGEPRNREAFYHCSLVLALPSGVELTAASKIEGEILDEFRGTGGFGYDPIFLITELGQTFAEIDFSVTCTKGFRARAAEHLFSNIVENSPGH